MIFSGSMLSKMFLFFSYGVVFGCGPCLAGCAPVLAFYSAAASRSVVSSIAGYLCFSAARIASYCVFGAAVFFIGRHALEQLPSGALSFLKAAGSIMVVFVGAVLFFRTVTGRGRLSECCARLGSHERRNAFLLGAAMAFLPCLPLLSVLGIAASSASSLPSALALMFSFGIGTAVSPLVAVSIFSGLARRMLTACPAGYLKAFNYTVSAALVFWGVRIFWGGL